MQDSMRKDEQHGGYSLKDNRKLICTIFVVVAGSLWGMMGLFVRTFVQDGFTSAEIAVIRSICATLLMGLFLLIKNKSLFKIKLRDIWCFVGTGVVSLTLFNLCYFTALQRTSMAVAAILMYTSPVFVVLLSALLFGEKINKVKVIALVVALLGIVLVTGVLKLGGNPFITVDVGNGISVSTIIIGIGSGVGYALYSIFGRFAIEKGYPSETITFYTFMFAALGLTACMLILGNDSTGALFGTFPQLIEKFVSGRPVIDVLLCIGIAVVVTILPYMFYTKGLTGIENGKAGIIASVEPVMAALIGMFVYGEILSVTGYAGVILVMAAIVLLYI